MFKAPHILGMRRWFAALLTFGLLVAGGCEYVATMHRRHLPDFTVDEYPSFDLSMRYQVRRVGTDRVLTITIYKYLPGGPPVHGPVVASTSITLSAAETAKLFASMKKVSFFGWSDPGGSVRDGCPTLLSEDEFPWLGVGDDGAALPDSRGMGGFSEIHSQLWQLSHPFYRQVIRDNDVAHLGIEPTRR